MTPARLLTRGFRKFDSGKPKIYLAPRIPYVSFSSRFVSHNYQETTERRGKQAPKVNPDSCSSFLRQSSSVCTVNDLEASGQRESFRTGLQSPPIFDHGEPTTPKRHSYPPNSTNCPIVFSSPPSPESEDLSPLTLTVHGSTEDDVISPSSDREQQWPNSTTPMNSTPHEQYQRHTGKQAQCHGTTMASGRLLIRRLRKSHFEKTDFAPYVSYVSFSSSLVSDKNHETTDAIAGQGQAAQMNLDSGREQQWSNFKTPINLTPHELHQRHTGKQAQSIIRQQITSWFKVFAWAASISTILTGLVLYIVQSYWTEAHLRATVEKHKALREEQIYKMLKDGPSFKSIEEPLSPRTSLQVLIRNLVEPDANKQPYPIIIGQHGVGKTALLKKVIKSIESPKGIVYLDITVGDDLLSARLKKSLLKAIGWVPDPVLDTGEPPSLDEIFDLFYTASYRFHKEHGKIPVLVIDNADRLILKQVELLEQLQDQAEWACDQGRAKFVLVPSEGFVPREMMERRAWSRHGEILEIGDLSKTESLNYLSSQNVDEATAEEAYSLVGGRIILLRSLRNALRVMRVKTFEQARSALLRDARAQFTAAGLLPPGPLHEVGLKADENTSRQYINGRERVLQTTWLTYTVGYQLFKANIVAHDIESERVNFHSQLIRRFCELVRNRRDNPEAL